MLEEYFVVYIPSLIHILQQLDDIQGYYLQKRRHCTKQSHRQEERVANVINREGYCAELEDFQSVLSTFTQYRSVFFGQYVLH